MTTRFNAVLREGDSCSRYNLHSGKGSGTAVFLFDEHLDEDRLRLLENFSDQWKDLEVLFPGPGHDVSMYIHDAGKVLRELKTDDGKFILVAFGRIVPAIIRLLAGGLAVTKLVTVNPEFDADIITLLSRIEVPSLIISSIREKNGYDIDSVKYHDLMSFSSITYIRQTAGNPLFEKFTQSFNSMLKFLADD